MLTNTLSSALASANGANGHQPSRSIAGPGFRDASSPLPSHTPPSKPAALPSQKEDEFGDFVDVPIPQPGSTAPAVSLLDFDNVPLPSRMGTTSGGGRKEGFFAFSPVKDESSSRNNYLPALGSSKTPSPRYPYLQKYKAHHVAQMAILSPILFSAAPPPPSQVLSHLFPSNLTPFTQSAVLLTLLRFLSAAVAPVTEWRAARQLILQASDRFDALCLTGFEAADERNEEEQMKEWAKAGWNVWQEASVSDKGKLRIEEWELGRTWIERREILYEIGGGGTWDPLKNIMFVSFRTLSPSRILLTDSRSLRSEPPEVPAVQLNFTPMDAFVTHALSSLSTSGSLATRVFPSSAKVLQQFADRVISDVIGEGYVQPLLSRAREVGSAGKGNDLFLRASAAVFAMVGRVVDAVVEAGRLEGEGGSKVGRSVVSAGEVEQLL